MLRLISALLGLVVLVVVASISLVLMVRDSAPVLPPMPEVSGEQRRWGKELLQAKVLGQAQAANGDSVIELSREDLDILSVLAAEQLNDGRLRIVLGNRKAEVGISTQLPSELGGWLNLDAEVVATGQAPAIASLNAGGLPVPAALASWLFDQAIISLKATDLLARVEITPSSVRLTPAASSGTMDSLLSAVISDDEQARAIGAQRRLTTLIEDRAGQSSIDGAELLSALIASAPATGSDHMAGNRAAVLALAAYVNGRDVPGAGPNSVVSQVPITMQGRTDIAQHFFTSAALVMQGGSELAAMLGLAKELDDADGGSGFSFRDLAADRAGSRFAELAGADPGAAGRISAMAREGMSTDDLMPAVDWLPANMSYATFQRDFGGRNGRAYQTLIEAIDRRINELPVAKAGGS